MNTSGALVMRAEQVGSQTVLAQIVQMVAPGAALARADAAHGRPGRRLVRASAVIAIAVADVLRLGPVRPGAELGLRPDQRRGRADHRLPCALGLATPMSIMVGHRPRGDAGRPVPRCRGDREPAQGRHADRRQDRHADRGQAGLRPRRSPRPAITEDEVLRLAASIDQGSEHPLPQAIVARGARARPGARQAGDVRVEHRHRRARHASTAGRVALGNTALMEQRRRRRGRACSAQAEALRARRRQRDVPGRRRPLARAARRVRSRSRRPRRRRSRRCATPGMRIVMATGDGLTTAQSGRRAARHRRSPWRGQAARTSSRSSSKLQREGHASSRWPATASTMRRRWPRPMSASRWARAPTSR